MMINICVLSPRPMVAGETRAPLVWREEEFKAPRLRGLVKAKLDNLRENRQRSRLISISVFSSVKDSHAEDSEPPELAGNGCFCLKLHVNKRSNCWKNKKASHQGQNHPRPNFPAVLQTSFSQSAVKREPH